MARYQSKYQTNSEERLKQALLELLGSQSLSRITVSELSQRAGVSRSTFYQHYGNVADVYAELVSDFRDKITPVSYQVGLCKEGCGNADHEPFCQLARKENELSAVVSEESFLATFIENEKKRDDSELVGLLEEAGIDETTARALGVFQFCGCYSATRHYHVDDEQWERTKGYIDAFIRGGIEACVKRAKKTAPERDCS